MAVGIPLEQTSVKYCNSSCRGGEHVEGLPVSQGMLLKLDTAEYLAGISSTIRSSPGAIADASATKVVLFQISNEEYIKPRAEYNGL